MVSQFLMKEFKVTCTLINLNIVKKLNDLKENDEKDKKVLELCLKFYFYINLAQLIIEQTI